MATDNTSLGNDDKLVPIFIKLPPDNIVLLKFTLESYDGLGILRTLSPEKGEVVVLALKDTECHVHAILESVEGELQSRIIPPPLSVEGDWLLAEYIKESSASLASLTQGK